MRIGRSECLRTYSNPAGVFPPAASDQSDKVHELRDDQTHVDESIHRGAADKFESSETDQPSRCRAERHCFLDLKLVL